MEYTKAWRRSLLTTAAGVSLLAATAPALAHINPEPRSVEAGSTTAIAFRVGHGCGESPTTSIALRIPEGVVGVSPRLLPGWEVETVEGPITPYESDGATITEGVTEVIWTGGPLPIGVFELFTIRATVPDTPGETLYFPVVQRCEVGENAWIEIPEEGQDGEDLESPAPALNIVAAASQGADGGPGGVVADVASEDDNDDGDTIGWVALGVSAIAAVLAVGSLAVGLRRR
ncbi:MAG: YcnI family protein [Phycisphaeraceae bacterium]|nr:YcnI family protein [Phycisphaeraceae bacterium]